MPFQESYPRLALSSGPEWVQGCFWRPNEAFIRELAQHLAGKRVLEIFSGNGYLAAWLQSLGVAVQATTRLSGHDSHEAGMYCEVQELEASQAVQTHGANSDVLLVCWPTATEATMAAARHWGPEKPVVFVGEVTDYEKGHLGGCASDAFFESIEITHRFEAYRGNMLEAAFECRLRASSALFPLRTSPTNGSLL